MPDQITPTRWLPDRQPASAEWPEPGVELPSFPVAAWRGMRGLCPACGQGRAFRGYLAVVPECSSCGAPLGRFRADDAPPYFTILIVGHLLVPVMFEVETTYHPAMWVHVALWVPTATLFTLALLRPVKGAVLGWMMKLGIMKTDD